MINWRVRFRNKTFWITAIPAALLLVQMVCALFGYEVDLGELGNRLLNVVEALFAFLAVIGVVTDHTTAGFGDSATALTYTQPKQN